MSLLEICDLPDEIWAQIFSRLPLDDRRSVRLCCRRFYEICNCDRFHLGERIVFEGDLNSGAAIASLSSSDRRTWNMELRRVRLEQRHFCQPFFRQQGPKVRSLTFHECGQQGQTESNIVTSFITSCPNLREIHFVFDRSENSQCFYRHFVDSWKMLNALKVVRSTVETFALEVPEGSSLADDFRLTVGDFLRIFDVFPNIRNLRLSIRVADDFNGSDTKLVEADVDAQAITFSCIRNQLLKMRRQLVELHLHFIGASPYEFLPARSWLQIGDIEAPNLKELSLNCICSLEDSVIICTFPLFKRLTHFDCVFPEEDTLYSTFLLQLLNVATELRTLKVRTARTFSMSAECFRALVASRLVTLGFYRYPKIDWIFTIVHCAFIDASFDRSATPNCTLRRLRMHQMSSQAWYLFSRYFTGLENFESVDFQPQTLLLLFQSLPKLSSLVLIDYKGFKIPQQEYCDPLSDHRLDNLTHLKITRNTSVVSEFLLRKFTFPNLKSLVIEQARLEVNFNWKALLLAIKKMSQLEELNIRCNDRSSFQQWLDLVNGLPKLRVLVVSGHDSQVFNDVLYRYLFQVRPSLRMINVITSVAEVYYGKDILINSVEKRVGPRKL